jgi:hypothetical protein
LRKAPLLKYYKALWNKEQENFHAGEVANAQADEKKAARLFGLADGWFGARMFLKDAYPNLKQEFESLASS